MEREFSSSPRKAVCDELLSVLVDKKISPSLDNASTEEIVQKLRDEYLPNTAYILYDNYLMIDQARFLPYCPMIARHLLNSTHSGCWRPVLMYLNKTAPREKPKEYGNVTFLLYLYCMQTGHVFTKIPDLQLLIYFLEGVVHKKDNYQWVDEEAAKLRKREMSSRIDEIRAIEAMATFNRRKWSRYGILPT